MRLQPLTSRCKPWPFHRPCHVSYCISAKACQAKVSLPQPCILTFCVRLHRLQAVQSVLRTSDWGAAQRQLTDVRHSPKLAALRDLLVQCGIITSSEGEAEAGPAAGEGGGLEAGGAGHRMLVFAQLKGTLDLVERDVMKRYILRTRVRFRVGIRGLWTLWSGMKAVGFEGPRAKITIGQGSIAYWYVHEAFD